MIIVTTEAYNKLKTRTQAELLSAVFGDIQATHEDVPTGFKSAEFDWSDRVDLSLEDVEEFMSTLGSDTKAGLKVFAKQGRFIQAKLLGDVGINDYSAFQRGTTRRIRTMTGSKHDFLLAWNDWSSGEESDCCYAVTSETYKSLLHYFNLN
jgi:hypothetical protein